MKTIERMKEIMNEKGIKQVELAKALGLSKTTINAWFNNNSDPKTDQLEQIADTLNVSVEYLVTGQERKDHLTGEEKKLIEQYRKINMDGQQKLWEHMDLLKRVYPINVGDKETEEEIKIG